MRASAPSRPLTVIWMTERRRGDCGRAHRDEKMPRVQRMRLNPLELPLVKQLRGDPLALGRAARSPVSERLQARTGTADKVVSSICPYCAVGCGQRVFVKDERVVQIEGDPDSPISRGRLCPKGSASKQLV